jgi:hypothetical protein
MIYHKGLSSTHGLVLKRGVVSVAKKRPALVLALVVLLCCWLCQAGQGRMGVQALTLAGPWLQRPIPALHGRSGHRCFMQWDPGRGRRFIEGFCGGQAREEEQQTRGEAGRRVN